MGTVWVPGTCHYQRGGAPVTRGPTGRLPVSEPPASHAPSCVSQFIFSSWSLSADGTPPAP